ncbi:hypothetical protein ACQB60_44875 [Actinomycetota bacterium Odt1-20B]
MTRRPLKNLMLRVVTWPLLAAFSVVARVWTLLGSTSPRRARRLADSDTAWQARQAAEARLRDIARTYAYSTPLALHLLVVEDQYTRGTVEWDLFTPVSPAFRVCCWMRLTGYFSSPLPAAQTITQILAEGERALSGIPFTHNTTREHTTGELAHAGHVLAWDQPGALIPEPEQPTHTYRFVREPRRRTCAVSAAGTARCSCWPCR